MHAPHDRADQPLDVAAVAGRAYGSPNEFYSFLPAGPREGPASEVGAIVGMKSLPAAPLPANAHRSRFLSATRFSRRRRSTCKDRWTPETAYPSTNGTRPPCGCKHQSPASTRGERSWASRVVWSTRKRSTSVWSICTVSKGRDATYWPGIAFVALTPLLSLRLSATAPACQSDQPSP